MYEVPAQYGWICPRCGKVHAPWVSECDCSNNTTTTTTSTDGTCVNVCDHAWIVSGQTTAGTTYRCARCGAVKSIPPTN